MKSGVGLPRPVWGGRRRGLSALVALVTVAALLNPTGADDLSASGAPSSDFNGDGRGDLVLPVAGENVSGRVDAGVLTIIYGHRTGVNVNKSQTIRPGAGLVAGSSDAGDHFGRSFDTGDFDRDGYADLVVGAPNDRVEGVGAAGSVTVVYGSSNGLNGSGSAVFSQAGNVVGEPETGDRFGSAVAVGDFNGDGYADVAVGAPGEDLESLVDAGSVTVIYGSPSGLVDWNTAAFTQGNLAGVPARDDRFGSSLAAGDFDGDGRDDLAVGSPGEDVRGRKDAGAVTVVYGTSEGLASARSTQFSQVGRVKGSPQANDRFGHSLAAGDFSRNGRDDLAIGVPGEDLFGLADAGMVNVLYAGPSGLRVLNNQKLTQAGPVNDEVEAGDRFGWSLATGDFDRNGRDDLAIGVPGEDLSGRTDAGMVNVLYGRRGRLRPYKDFSFSQSGSFAGDAESHDLLGNSVRVVDLDGDGFDDLVAGVPGEDHRGATDAGIANLVFGSKNGLRLKRNQTAGQQGAVAGSPQSGDGLGRADYETWLDRVNLYRTQAGLDPVSERARLSADAEKHSRYMVRNGVVSHDEVPGRPGYSAAGDASGRRSNVYGTSLASTADITAVDGWVTGPFHAVGFLTPSLTHVGYGSYSNPNANRIRMAATLDIYGAPRNWNKSADGAYTWPGEGSVVPVRRHINEWPSPRSECPNHDGLPVLAFFEESVNVTGHSFTHNGQPIQHCVFDGTNYSNADGGARSLGRSILSSANAVVLMPKQALEPGEEYCFSARSKGVTTGACFTVDPNA